MDKKRKLPEDAPAWLTEECRVSEPAYSSMFLEKHPMLCVGETFYSMDGEMLDVALLKKEIFEDISPWTTSKVSNKVGDIWSAIKLLSAAEEVPLHTDRIHVDNGTLYLDGTFTEEKQFCRNRLNVSYREDAGTPERWLSFLHELLEDEDIVTLQEYAGYCLIPVTKAQKMMMIIGKGGEGKSRIGLVLGAIFGNSMNTTSIQKVEKDKFARADLGNRLLMIDDDMDMSALEKTNYIKTIVTSEGKMDVEKKNLQSYQYRLYVRFLCFGNGALTALHDRSDGFFRRQIILTTKDRPEGRIDDPYLVEKLIEEKNAIFLWCVEGLKRLIANDYHFTLSEREIDNVAAAVRDANNIPEFLAADDYVEFHADAESSTRELYDVYKEWCDDNAESVFSMKSFSMYFSPDRQRSQ